MTYAPGDPRSKLAKQKYYNKTRDRWLKHSAERHAKRRLFYNQVKSLPCADCKKTYPPCVMDFDHSPDDTKSLNLATMFSGGYSIESMILEMSKCDVVCSNCHRIRTYNRSVSPEKRISA